MIHVFSTSVSQKGEVERFGDYATLLDNSRIAQLHLKRRPRSDSGGIEDIMVGTSAEFMQNIGMDLRERYFSDALHFFQNYYGKENVLYCQYQIHMAWVRIAAGRLKSDYRYSPSVYYNFPWCKPTDKQRQAIEQSAQKILDVRANYPDATLADLYDELSMPKDLRSAHKKKRPRCCSSIRS